LHKIKDMTTTEFLNNLDEWDTVFDPNGKREYTEAQLIRFAELYLSHHMELKQKEEYKSLADAHQEERMNDRMNVIGQNGNDGLHYE
jgi:hypothetical protein